MFKKLLSNTKGLSLVEVMVAVGIFGVLTVSFTQLLENQSDNQKSSRQDEVINETLRAISQGLSNKSTCDSILGTNPNSLNFSSLTLPTSSNNSVSVNHFNTAIVSPGAGIQSAPISITLRFTKTDQTGSNKTVNHIVQALGQFNNGSFISCMDAEEESKRDSLRIFCQMIGGTFAVDGSGNDSCDFSGISDSSEMAIEMKRSLCEELYKGNYNAATGRCDSLEVQGDILTGNLQSGQVQIDGEWRSNFNHECTGYNEFVRGIARDGTLTCVTVKVCTPGIDCSGACTPDTSCQASTPVGDFCSDGCGNLLAGMNATCVPTCSTTTATSYNSNQTFADSCGNAGACMGTACNYLDNYAIDGGAPSTETAWASATQSCRYTDYVSPSTTPGACGTPATSITATAGSCKKITGCSGATPGSVINSPDGTDCGSGNTCQAGVCTSNCTPPSAISWGSCYGTLVSYNSTTKIAGYSDSATTLQGAAQFRCQSDGTFQLMPGYSCAPLTHSDRGGGDGRGGHNDAFEAIER